MNIAEEIYRQAQQLPDELAREVLDFIGYLQVKHALDDLLVRQHRSQHRFVEQHVRENPDDAVWNELLFRQR